MSTYSLIIQQLKGFTEHSKDNGILIRIIKYQFFNETNE